MEISKERKYSEFTPCGAQETTTSDCPWAAPGNYTAGGSTRDDRWKSEMIGETEQRNRWACNTCLQYKFAIGNAWKHPAMSVRICREMSNLQRFSVQMQPRDKLDRRLINCRRSLWVLSFAEPIPEPPILIRRLRKWSGNSSRIFVVWTEATVGRLGQRVNKSLTQT